MPAPRKQYICLLCEKRYAELEEAEVCEMSHAVTPAMRANGLTCVFCDQDPCQCVSTPKREVLAPAAMLRLGALTVQTEQSNAVEAHLDDQRIAYEEALRIHGPEGLIVALLERDRMLLNQGRTLADQRAAGRLLREFMRGALYSAGGKPQIDAAEAAIRRLGGEEADQRQLKLHGSTLGPLEPVGTVAEELASGERKAR